MMCKKKALGLLQINRTDEISIAELSWLECNLQTEISTSQQGIYTQPVSNQQISSRCTYFLGILKLPNNFES